MTIDGRPFSTSERKRTTFASLRRALLGEVQAGADSDRESDRRRDADEHQRADDRVRHSAARFADAARGMLVKKSSESDDAPS